MPWVLAGTLAAICSLIVEDVEDSGGHGAIRSRTQWRMLTGCPPSPPCPSGTPTGSSWEAPPSRPVRGPQPTWNDDIEHQFMAVLKRVCVCLFKLFKFRGQFVRER